MLPNLSKNTEDYLKAIYHLTRYQARAGTNEIAEQMGVTAASATGMIQKLATSEPPYVEYQKYHGVCLSAAGRQAALETIRRHRILETYLHHRLGYSWDAVHDEADRLEHFISEELEERLAVELGNPDFDPHGHPIPTRELELPNRQELPLSELYPGQQAVVLCVEDDTPELLRYLVQIGLAPHVRVTVLSRSPFDHNLEIRIEEKQTAITLGIRVTENIFVTVLENIG
jgi:DtxR family Mn-dependent transcriptional regulator